MEHKDYPVGNCVTFRIRGNWSIQEYDTLNGSIKALPARYENGNTVFERTMYSQTSLLLKLLPQSDTLTHKAADFSSAQKEGQPWPCSEGVRLNSVAKYRLDEPNVLLLDQAQYRLDGGDWMPSEEILRIDTICRRTLGYPLHMETGAQPWAEPATPPTHTLEMRFSIHSEEIITGAMLALEELETTAIRFNGKCVEKEDVGYFVDESIRKVNLPPIPKGLSILELSLPYGRRSMPEWCYILGNFGVRLTGNHADLIKMPERIGFGDYAIHWPCGRPVSAG